MNLSCAAKQAFRADSSFEHQDHQESLIRLSDITDSSVIFEHAENRDNTITFHDPPLVFAQTGTLIPGHIYELDIDGMINKPDFFEGTFSDTLTVTLNFPVPDNTGTCLLLALSICALVVFYNCPAASSRRHTRNASVTPHA